MTSKRRPTIAVILSLFGTGLGHLYGGKPVWAVSWLAVNMVTVNIALLILIRWDTGPYNIIIPLAAIVIMILSQIVHAWRSASGQPRDYERRRYNRWYYYLLWWLVTFAVALFVNPYPLHYRSFRVSGASMENTFLSGELFIVDMEIYKKEKPKRGDVVIVVPAIKEYTRYLERCVAVPGDMVEIIDKELYVNGELQNRYGSVKHIDTTYDGSQQILPRGYGGQNSRDNFGPYFISEGTYFMMGDNRDNSYDSRYWGAVSAESVLGKAVRIYYSPDWSRVGLRVE